MNEKDDALQVAFYYYYYHATIFGFGSVNLQSVNGRFFG